MRIVHDADDADDVVQIVFLRAWCASEADRAYRAAWLVVVTKNVACDVLRRRKRDRVRKNAFAGMLFNTTEYCDPQSLALKELDAELLLQAVATLPARQRGLVIASYYKGLSHDRIAHTACVPVGTVKTRIRSGILTLRKRLSP